MVQNTPSPSSSPPPKLYMIIQRLTEGGTNQEKGETERARKGKEGKEDGKEETLRKPQAIKTRQRGLVFTHKLKHV